MKKTLLFIAIAAAFTACKKEISSKVDQDKIWTYYELFYDQNTDITYATATFRFSSELGTHLELSDPSLVTVDGTEIPWISEFAYYQLEFSGIKTTAEFVWTDLDGNIFTNSIELRDIDFPVVIDDTLLHTDSANYFMWEGLALDSFETAKLTLIGEGDSDDRIFSVDTLNATTITIDSLKLLQVDSGMVILQLDKFYSPPLSQETSRGGLLRGKYRPTNRQIYLD